MSFNYNFSITNASPQKGLFWKTYSAIPPKNSRGIHKSNRATGCIRLSAIFRRSRFSFFISLFGKSIRRDTGGLRLFAPRRCLFYTALFVIIFATWNFLVGIFLSQRTIVLCRTGVHDRYIVSFVFSFDTSTLLVSNTFTGIYDSSIQLFCLDLKWRYRKQLSYF